MDKELEEKKPETVALTDWWIFRRVQEVEAARRVNYIRGACLFLLFAVHWYVWLSREQVPDADALAWHYGANRLALGALCVVVGVHLSLRFRVFPLMAKYLTTISDVVLLTAAAMLGEKAQSSLVPFYLLIIAMTYLRFSRQLVVTAVVTCIAGYYALVGVEDSTWFDADHITPVDQQLVTVIAMVLAGAIGWQLCEMAKSWFETQATLRDSSQAPSTSSTGSSQTGETP